MSQMLRCLSPQSVIIGWDFSTGGVKCLAFDLHGEKLAEVRLPTDLWTGPPGTPPEKRVSELNLMQLEGQARASTRGIAARLRELGRLKDWVAGGISATHHTAGRIDGDHNPIRRAICWNDHTLAAYQQQGLKRLGGQNKVRDLIDGPWAIRYSLSHLVKDETTLEAADWERTAKMLLHGPLAAGYLTGNFDVTSVSSAASTGIMNLQHLRWCREMLAALKSPAYRDLAWKQLPKIVDHYEPLGRLAEHVALEAGIANENRPWIFPTSDDQQAGLIGGGAVDPGHVAVILGTSVVVNSAFAAPPVRGNLDVMRLNWGPYLVMRCYNNGAQFLNQVVGSNPNWDKLEKSARAFSPGAEGTVVLPFEGPEPSLGVTKPCVKWYKGNDASPGKKYRATLEALAYLIALGVEEHEKAGQQVERITVSGGIARSRLMCEILASVLNRRLDRLQSDEGPALGAAVTALAAVETHLRRERGIQEEYKAADAVQAMVKFKDAAEPIAEWVVPYRKGLEIFRERLAKVRK